MIRLSAEKREVQRVLDQIQKALQEVFASEDEAFCVLMSAEELLTNIVSYAYQGAAGETDRPCFWIDWGYDEGKKKFWVYLKDQGIPYDPLARPDPELFVPLEDRQAGGLGIYMVKRYMDDVDYRYEEGYNCMLIGKRIRG